MLPKTTAKTTLPLRTMQKALGNVTAAVERKTLVPALSGVRIQPLDGAVEFTTTNRTLSIRVRYKAADAKASEPLLLQAFKLDSYVRLLEGDTVSVSALDPRRAVLQCGGTSTRLALISPAGFPFVEEAPAERSVSIGQVEMERMLRHVSFAASKEAKQAALCGALLEIADGKANLIATDGHRLARYSVPSKSPSFKMALPEELLGAMNKTVDGSAGGNCSFAATEATTFACFDGTSGLVSLSHRSVGGRFPDYRAILPSKAEASVKLSASSLVAAVKRCMSIADVAAQVVTFAVSPSELKLSAVSAQTGETVDKLQVSSAFQFPPLTLHFWGSYVLDALARVTGTINLSFARVGGGMGLWITHDAAQGETFEYVLMEIKAK